MIEDLNVEVTVGADKGYDAHEFIQACLEMKVTPHVAQNTSGRRSAVPDAIAGTKGYAISQQKRKLIEQGFGWAKTVGRMRQVMVRGRKKVDQMFVLRYGRLQPRAHALAGTNPPTVAVIAVMRPETVVESTKKSVK
ncbi:transposase [Cupriavidus basilensis]